MRWLTMLTILSDNPMQVLRDKSESASPLPTSEGETSP